MKKLLIILSVFIVLTFTALIISPILFEDDLKVRFLDLINEQLKAKADFNDLELSFIKSFPKASIKIDGFSIINNEDFDNNKLADIKSIELKVDIMSLINSIQNNTQINIQSIIIDQPEINLKTLKNGISNWDIAKDDTSSSESKGNDESDISLSLDVFKIINSNISYVDNSIGLKTSLNGLNFDLNGDLSSDRTQLDMNLMINKTNVSFENISYLKNTEVSLDASVDADLKNMNFILSQNSLKLNQLTLILGGSIKMNPDNYDLDLNWSAPSNEIKQIVSLIPYIYRQDLDDINSSGNLTCLGKIKGKYSDDQIPDIDLNINLKDGKLKYPDLPSSINDINMSLNVNGKNNDLDALKVDLTTLSFKLGSNPFNLNLKISHLVSDPNIELSANTKIDLTTLSDAIPIEDVNELKGVINVDIDFKGRYSSIEQENYSQLNTSGHIELDQIIAKTKYVPYTIKIQSLKMRFTPDNLSLDQCKMNLGKSDLSISGHFENYLAYLIEEGQKLKGSFKLRSNVLNTDELLDEESSVESEEEPLEVYPLPKDLDLNINASIGSLTYDSLSYQNINGYCRLNNGHLNIKNSSASLFGSTITMTGIYHTDDPKSPFNDGHMTLSTMNLKNIKDHFPKFSKKYPLINKLNGSFGLNIDLTSGLDSTYMPLLNSLSSSGLVNTSNMLVNKSALIDKVVKVLKIKKNINGFKLKDQSMKYEFVDGTLFLDPVAFSIEDINGTFSGTYKLDQQINYIADIKVPLKYLGNDANSIINDLTKKANQQGIDLQVKDPMPLKVLIEGNINDPKITTDLKNSSKNTMEDLKQKAKEELEKKKKELEAKAKAEAERIKQLAEKKKKEIENKAKAEAEKKKKQLEAKAKAEAEKKKKEAEAKAKSEAEKAKKKAQEDAKNKIKGLFGN